MKSTKGIALLGTGSDVGKSLLTAALCRFFADMGKKVAPYKAQNMSNNSGVTFDGLEMGRAQIVQAEACRIEPSVHMNPVLLKPTSQFGSQIIVQGKVIGQQSAREYYDLSRYCAEKAFESYSILAKDYEYIIMEGAGSCAELNLKDRDFVNIRAAQKANVPIVLVADIDRGGVFAQIIGTLMILPPEERVLFKGIIINKFRGDVSLFDDGVKLIEDKCGIPVLGVVPFLTGLQIEEEDSVALDHVVDKNMVTQKNKHVIYIAVITLGHISNYTDIRVLESCKYVEVHYVRTPRDLRNYDCVIIPGSKSTISDMKTLEESGWKKQILSYQGKIVGLCGGYQMLGKGIYDPYHIEGNEDSCDGLGLLNCETTMEKTKCLTRVSGKCEHLGGVSFSGYEIHMGETTVNSGTIFSTVTTEQHGITKSDGAMDENNRVWGSYIHGIFDSKEFLEAFLQWVNGTSFTLDDFISQDHELDRLCEHFKKHVNIKKLLSLIESGM